MRSATRCAPTCPAPCTTTRRPSTAARPSRASPTARIAASTPTAVIGDGSPDPPRAGSTPVTHGVSRAIMSMSPGVAPTSSAARYRPPSSSMARPSAREHRLGVRRVRMVDHDHGLAPALVEARARRLHGHGLGQAQHVREGVLLGVVAPEADAAERRTQRGRVDRDHRPQPRRRVGHEHHLLVTPLEHRRRDRARVHPSDATRPA